ncbi:MAG TPA: cytochrome c oxidase subunit 3 [Candidatus Methylomirabilis sp.]|nr:cytochrome c oxidase subunit 3 [Candidatus Methylomirabilis sp.]
MTSVAVGDSADVDPRWRGRVGMIGLIVAETSLFSVFVVAYLYYIGKSLNGPYPKEVLELPVFNTICLLSSSITITFALRALRVGAARRSGVWFLVTIALGVVFLVGTAREWYGLIVGHGLTISTNLFGTTFYSLVGLHASHVTIGLVILTLLCVFAFAGALRGSQVERAEIASWYWHFVDAVWVVVFTVVYVVGR